MQMVIDGQLKKSVKSREVFLKFVKLPTSQLEKFKNRFETFFTY